jgi:pimeloyl-ACP methyl ester carboxylesterase
MEAAYATVGVVAHLGNYNSDALRPANSTAIGPWGTYDMAGNVREWVTNATSQGRLAMGGSWNDYESNYYATFSVRPMSRSAENGLRLMHQPDPVLAALKAPVTLLLDSPRSDREPVSDEVFEGMRLAFEPSRQPPEDITVEVLEDSAERRIEEVTLHYRGQDSFTLYIAIPKPAPDSLQSIIYMPSGGAFLAGRTPNRMATDHFDHQLDFVLRSGRAAVVPIWAGSRDRYFNYLTGDQSKASIDWYSDVTKTINYLVDRDGFSPENIAYVGFSYGALFGPVLLAVEERFKTGVLISGGIIFHFDLHGLLDLNNFAPRIQQPILLVNGRFDPIVPYGMSQQRLLALMPNPKNKQQLFDELGHWGFPRHRFHRTVVDWLDEQLGSVR